MSAPLRLGGVPEHFNLPWHLARESGDLADLDLTWQDQPGGTGEMLQRLEAGELDLVSILTAGTVAALTGGAPVTIVQVYVSSPLQWGVHVPGDADIVDESQLAGRRIAISRWQSGSHLMAYVQAQRQSWGIDREQFVVVGGLEGARQAFASGEADAFLWDRFMTQPLVDSGEFKRIAVQPTPWPAFVIAAHTDALTGRTTEVGRVIDTVVAAATRLHDRPGIVAEIISRYGLSEVAARGWLDSTTFAPRAPFDRSIADETSATLARAGFTDG